MGPVGEIGRFRFRAGVFVGVVFAFGGDVVEVDVLAVGVLWKRFGCLGAKPGLQRGFMRLWWIGVVGEWNLAILVFGYVRMMSWARYGILMSMLLIGLIGRSRLEKRGRIEVVRCRWRCSCVAVVED